MIFPAFSSLPRLTLILLCLTITGTAAQWAVAAEEQSESQTIQAAGGKLELTAPGDWKVKKPRSRILEHELSVPAVEGDQRDARLTMMGAGGSIDANLKRWKGQFQRTEKMQQESWKLGPHQVTLLDIQGTFLERRGPFAPATQREDYRMMGGIVQLDGGGLYFVKFYGPKSTVSQNAESFRKMLGSK